MLLVADQIARAVVHRFVHPTDVRDGPTERATLVLILTTFKVRARWLGEQLMNACQRDPWSR